jgi:hypothetical protein
VKSVPEISVKAYHFGLKKVMRRDEANFVTLKVQRGKMIDYLILPKSIYDLSRDEEKPVKSWKYLPIEI